MRPRRVFPLDIHICVRATELPLIDKDPCDRLIIATAQIHDLPVVTSDPVFREYDIEVISSRREDGLRRGEAWAARTRRAPHAQEAPHGRSQPRPPGQG
jgi:hypothetical protein